jgi:hypothetical protein
MDMQPLGSPFNRSNLCRWLTLVPASIIRGQWVNSRLGFRPMRVAWITSNGFAGPGASSALSAHTRRVGDLAMVGSCAQGVAFERR